MKSYCYVGRYNHDKVYVNANVDDILLSVHRWVNEKPWPKVPNQCDPEKYVIDIGCSTDIALMQKYIKDYLDNVFYYFVNIQDKMLLYTACWPYSQELVARCVDHCVLSHFAGMLSSGLKAWATSCTVAYFALFFLPPCWKFTINA